ncbi:hypothetical protein C5Y96_23680 [Blastopirellula marina]|uniref:Carboxypeptidase regulatory-like domain-containing protein n=1 Tax=Blastopirellula marina TaxID=124 RepID=A0A2S8F0Y8_9BACT|nr:hypothetical protein C5Y96_23680 [Blastopirellula marina]RCS43493.1 hypothetical protein DTL36_23730 [Bremerella cremea]
MLAGCEEAKPGLKGVQGKVTVDGQPAPEGSQVSFNLVGGSYSFTTRTSATGEYSYLPPPQAPLEAGEYEVAVLPPPSQTTTDETGLSIEVKTKGAPKNYGKFSDPKSSGIKATLGGEVITLDIAVET